jgi:octaprenyl-diphosphate synthase
MSTVTLPPPATNGKPRESFDLYAPIAGDLEATERILHDSLSSNRPGVADLMGYLGNYRGKRLRPALLLLTARACGQVNASHHLLAAVVEMIHTATLVHDDVLDDATMRRHTPTVNASWGNQASILLGDYLFTHAFHLTSTLGQARACQIIGEATNRLCAGELHQVCQRGNMELSEEDYFDIIDGKTAELTSCCCRLGALYSGMSDEVVERLARYGRYLGLAFQIADDLLDLVGEERAAGKSLGTDLEQRKLTLPLIRMLRQAPAEEASMLRQLLTRPGNHKRELLAPRLDASGALAYARGRAEQFADQAEKELACLPSSSCKTILQRITRQVVHRSS